MTTSARIISATLRVLLNGALKTGTPWRLAADSSTWLVPMQKQPMVRSLSAPTSELARTWVLLRMPSTWTSRRRSRSSSSLGAYGRDSTWKPALAKASCELA